MPQSRPIDTRPDSGLGMAPKYDILSFYYGPKRGTPGAALDWPQFPRNSALTRFGGRETLYLPPQNKLGLTRWMA